MVAPILPCPSPMLVATADSDSTATVFLLCCADTEAGDPDSRSTGDWKDEALQLHVASVRKEHSSHES